MGALEPCSLDDCPPANISADYTTKCGICGHLLHLPCVGINRKVDDVLFHPCILVLCGKCCENNAAASLKSSSTSSLTPNNLKKTPQQTPRQPLQTNLHQYSISNAKIEEMFKLLQNVDKNVSDTKEIAETHFKASKSYSDVLKEIKEVSVSANEKLKTNNTVSYAAIARRRTESSSFPSLNSPNKRPRKDIETPSTKPQFKGRALTSGTASVADHGLGETVSVNKLKRVSPYAHLKKAIYISRLQTSVTTEKIAHYIKTKTPDLKENDILLRMLVKKDQSLDDLTFISFRLSCTEELYVKLIDPSFWPEHVKIGEFIERERKQASVSDFFVNQSSGSGNASPNLPSNTKKDDSTNMELN